MNRSLACGLCALVIASIVARSAAAADGQLVLHVWPGKAPGENGEFGEEKFQDPNPDDKKPIKRLTNITKPTLTVYRPAKAMDTGAAVVICPGGGYSILAWDLEGEEVAEWLNSIGVTGILLKYRVPKRADLPRHVPPVQDAQRALSVVRSKAAEWDIDSNRVGMLGFSAGGHLTAAASTNFDKRTYNAIDEIDQVSCRPDFAVLVYPGGMVEKGELNPEIHVSKETPPTFFAHANDDSVSPENSAVMYLALKRAGVSAELHVFASGGHGFGLRPSDHPCSTWPKRCEEWMKDGGFLSQRDTRKAE